ncbi:hypothetical protein HER39_01450, partial [Arthrobacter deserti]|nr:hypothetical protein [Arthrobacter deserti]
MTVNEEGRDAGLPPAAAGRPGPAGAERKRSVIIRHERIAASIPRARPRLRFELPPETEIHEYTGG